MGSSKPHNQNYEYKLKNPGERFLNAPILSILNTIKCLYAHIIRASLTTLITSGVPNWTLNNQLNTKHWVSRDLATRNYEWKLKNTVERFLNALLLSILNTIKCPYTHIIRASLTMLISSRMRTEHLIINWIQNIGISTLPITFLKRNPW